MSVSIVRCTRCGKRNWHPEREQGWNGEFVDGVIVAVVCPGCQSTAENLEAEVNSATLDYMPGPAPGRVYGRAKAGAFLPFPDRLLAAGEPVKPDSFPQEVWDTLDPAARSVIHDALSGDGQPPTG